MDEQKRPRAWVYARIPGDYDGTMNSYKVCSMQALHDGCDIAAADSFDGFITELQNMGYTVKYGPRVEHIAVRHKDAQRNIRIDRLDPRFSETALREYYRQLHRMPTEMQQEYRQENAPAKPKWQPTELQPIVRRARYLGKLPRRYPKVSGFMACYYRDRFSNQCHRTDTNWQVNATKRACLSGRGYCPNAVHQPAGSLYTVQHNNGFPCAAYRYFDPSQQGQL